MRNFLKLAEGVNPLPLMQQIQRQPDLWNENTLRTSHPGTAHSEVSDIWVWFNQISKTDPLKVVNDKAVVPYRAWHMLPAIRPLIFALMNQVDGVRLGRVIITRLPPGKEITPHTDGGAPATYFQRYQIALQSLPGCIFKIEDEEVNFLTGEVWHIDNLKVHSVINNSADDRIVIIVDIRTG